MLICAQVQIHETSGTKSCGLYSTLAMGVHEPEIEKWVASTSQKNAIIDFGDDDDLDSVLALSEVRDVWPVFLETSLRRVLSSKTKSRVSYLKRQILPLAKDSGKFLCR